MKGRKFMTKVEKLKPSTRQTPAGSLVTSILTSADADLERFHPSGNALGFSPAHNMTAETAELSSIIAQPSVH